MAESDLRHLQNMDRTSIEGKFSERQRGQRFGLCIGLAGLCVAAFLGFSGHDWLAGVIGGTTLVSLVAVFVLGRVLPSKPS